MFRRIRKKMKNRTYLMDILAIMIFFAAMVLSVIGLFKPEIPQVTIWALLCFGLIINWQAEIIRKNKERHKNVLMDVWLHRVKFSLDDIRYELYQENPCNETMLKDCEEALGKIHECYKELGQC